MAYETVLYDVADRICTVTLNRPEKLNAWTRQMHLDLKDAMHTAGADPEVRAIILTGAGRGFCAGADMGGLQAIGAGGGGDRTTKSQADLPGGSTLGRIRMNYFLFPGDPEIHHRCDQRPGSRPGLRHSALCRPALRRESAVFTTAFAQRGLIAEHGVSWLLPRLVGLPAAMDLCGAPPNSPPPEAFAFGLVSRVIADLKRLWGKPTLTPLSAETAPPPPFRETTKLRREVLLTLAEAPGNANNEFEFSLQTSNIEGTRPPLTQKTGCGAVRGGPPKPKKKPHNPAPGTSPSLGERRGRGLPPPPGFGPTHRDLGG